MVRIHRLLCLCRLLRLRLRLFVLLIRAAQHLEVGSVDFSCDTLLPLMLILTVTDLTDNSQLHALLDKITGYLGQLPLCPDIMPVGVVRHLSPVLQLIAPLCRCEAELCDTSSVIELPELGILADVTD